MAIGDSKVIVFPVKAAITSPFLGAVSYGKPLILYRNNASDFSFAIFAIAGRIFELPDLGVAVGIGLGTGTKR